jgi:adenylate cyclase
VSAAILVSTPVSLGNDWPIQTRLCGQEFLYVLLLLAEAALTYSPRRVIWTGVSILGIWSIRVFTIYSEPEMLRFNDAAAEGALTSTAVLDLSFEPTFVDLTAWYTQLIPTFLFTLLITLTVWRSRRTLLNWVEVAVVRAGLAWYVSPDVAEALTTRVGTELGPVSRTVAVLFADIVSFTRLMEPFSLLRSCAIVFRHGGTLDKYLGDELQGQEPVELVLAHYEPLVNETSTSMQILQITEWAKSLNTAETSMCLRALGNLQLLLTETRHGKNSTH